MRRITLVLAATACLAGLAQPAYGTPTTGSFEQEITHVDDGASAACGFTVTFHQLDRGTYQLFFDQQGDLTRVQVQTLVNGTATANGITLLVHGRENNFYDLVTGTQMDASLEFRVWLPGLGVVIMDTGRLSPGNVILPMALSSLVHRTSEGEARSLPGWLDRYRTPLRPVSAATRS